MLFDRARELLIDAIARRAFPAASVEVGTSSDVLWREAFGRLTYDAGSPTTRLDTVFDLASLTKVIAATGVAMRLVERRALDLEDPIDTWVAEWRGDDRAGVTIEDALSHTTGLPAWLPLYRDYRGNQFASAIGRLALEYPPRAKSVYSDLGFILLGFALEAAGGMTLDKAFDDLHARLGLGDLTFLPLEDWRGRTAPTEYDPVRGRLLVGEVHDDNAAALGGVAAHAGLFGTSSAVGRFARIALGVRTGKTREPALASHETIVRFTTRRNIENSSRALGWDTMLPTSSCGTKMSASAFGHTGFTGTSLWIDPEVDVYIVLLTNRVHPSRANDEIRLVRPAFHDAVVDAMHLRGR
jgi:CubicO group peptidase (beta-lactamase class C family)